MNQEDTYMYIIEIWSSTTLLEEKFELIFNIYCIQANPSLALYI